MREVLPDEPITQDGVPVVDAFDFAVFENDPQQYRRYEQGLEHSPATDPIHPSQRMQAHTAAKILAHPVAGELHRRLVQGVKYPPMLFRSGDARIRLQAQPCYSGEIDGMPTVASLIVVKGIEDAAETIARSNTDLVMQLWSRCVTSPSGPAALWSIIAVERGTRCVAVFEPSRDLCTQLDARIARAIVRFDRCRRNGEWPGQYDAPIELKPRRSEVA
jgi:hypothetical protein